MKIGTDNVMLEVWDTPGQEDYDSFRPLDYPETDVVLVWYAVTVDASYGSVWEKVVV